MNFGKKPMIVVDRSILSFRRIEEFIPADAAIVLPDAFFHEALEDMKGPDRKAFDQWARKHKPDSLLVGRYWSEISRRESEFGQPIDPRDCIDHEYSYRLQADIRDDGLDWDPGNKTEVVAEKREDGNAFVAFCSRVSQSMREGSFENSDQGIGRQGPIPSVRISRIQECVQLVRQPGFVTSWVVQSNPTYAGNKWEALLDRFPDVLAVARWSRLMAWYGLSHALRCEGERELRSSYLDAQYGFIASYVGRIATNDDGMLRAVRAVFPDCELYTERPIPAIDDVTST